MGIRCHYCSELGVQGMPCHCFLFVLDLEGFEIEEDDWKEPDYTLEWKDMRWVRHYDGDTAHTY